MKKDYNYHYVYRITNIITGYHYYGSKSCNEYPKENIGIKYFSTSTNKLFIQDQKNNPQDYKYKVIKIFETCRKDATQLEVDLHKRFDVKNHPKFLNKANQTSSGFDVTGWTGETHPNYGKIVSKETKAKISLQHKGKITVKDYNGNYYKVDIDDIRLISNELIPMSLGRKQAISAKRKIGDAKRGIPKTDKQKEKISNTKKSQITTKTKEIRIYNSNDELVDITNGNFVEICEKYGIPEQTLRKTIYENRPMYLRKPPKDKHNLKFKGWYAKVVD